MPAKLYASPGSKDIVVAVSLVKLGAFNGGMDVMPVEYQDSIVQEPLSVLTHPMNHQDTFSFRAASGKCMDQVGIAILIPEWTGINPPLGRAQQVRFTPGSSRIGGFRHIYPKIRVSVVDIVLPLVITNGGCPCPIAMLWYPENSIRDLPFKDMVYELPVYHIPGMQYRDTGNTIKTGGYHVEIFPDPGHIRI